MRSSKPADSIVIDGQSIKTVHRPVSAMEVAELLKDAGGLGRTVAPAGGGTKLALGNLPDPIDEAINLAAIDRVLHFEPADLTLSVEAGARLADVQRTLAERGQTLPIEVPDPEQATIGGLIATAMAGPRRLGSGTLRDLLIGISAAYPSGSVAKAGGMVVKNVTGFDLMRLHLGALGTLGVIVSANFKTAPMHRAESTVIAAFETIDAAFDASDRVRSGRIRPLALEVVKTNGAFMLAVRLSGRQGTVDLLVGETNAEMGAGARTIGSDESASWWRHYVQDQSLSQAGRVLIRCGAAPKETRRLATAVSAQLLERGLSAELLAASPGLGSLVIGLPAASLTAKSLAGLQAALLNVSAHVTILSAPADLKSGIDVWGRQPETLAVMQALRAEFDPSGAINPGRMVGRI